MKTLEQDLLAAFYEGFNHELDGVKKPNPNPNPLIEKAYLHGRGHAVLGEDIRSADYITHEQILKLIMPDYKKLKNRITRQGKLIIAEVYYHLLTKQGNYIEVLIDYKSFNRFFGDLLGIEPTQKTYNEAKHWAEAVMSLHQNNTKN